MEQIDCIFCGINDTCLLIKKDSFNVVRCNRCGLVYINPRPDANEIAELYNALEGDKRIVTVHDMKHDAYKIKKFKNAIQLLKRQKKDVRHIFDLGCSTGIFLELATKEGWIPYGSDVNRDLVIENQKKYGDRVQLQKGAGIDFPDKHFDVVTLFDVVEHLPDPVAMLEESYRVLKDNGLIVVTTPAIDGLFPRLTYTLFGKTIGAWEHPIPPGHLFQFSGKTLRKTLKKTGFQWLDHKNFGIYAPFTVGKLREAIIDALRKNHTEKENNDHGSLSEGNMRHESDQPLSNPFSFFKKLSRSLMHIFCWVLVAIIYPLAALLKRGDSMIVIVAKK